MQQDNLHSTVPRPNAALRKALVEAAIRAPSGDNCQPWHFRFNRDRVQIDILADRAQSAFDFRHRATFISVGAVLENIRVQAACMGLAVTVSYPSDASVPVTCASLRWGAPADERCHTRLAALRNRTVNRRPFLPLRIAAEKQRTWTAEPIPGTEVTIIEDRREIARWARLIYLGDRIRWTHPTLHAELFAKMLFSRAEAERKRAGLEIDRLGAGPIAAQIMRLLRPWERMERFSRYGVDRMLASQTQALASCAGALVLVTIRDNEAAQWIRAGEQVQRLWITAHQQGLCVQPLPVALYMDQRFQEEGMANFLSLHRPLLDEVRSALAGLLGNRVGAMLYRVGYGWRMSQPAVRQPAESFYDAAE